MTKKRSENAIILIGNGFDLAHNMKTSYNDFAEWYVKEYIYNRLFEATKSYTNLNDEFLKSSFITGLQNIFNGGSFPNNYSDRSVRFNLDTLGRMLLLSNRNDENFKDTILKFLLENINIVSEIIKNDYLGRLYSNSYINWFDIENSYFFELKKILSEEGVISFDSPNKKTVIKLNKEFSEIKYALQEYLKTIKIETNEKIKAFFENNFIGKEYINIVNFNYTNTINQYLNSFEYSIKVYDDTKIYTNINYIHGRLDKEIIFGYGDDDSEDYKTMKQTGKDEYLKHFKTFAYLEDHNYRDLINLLDSVEDYEVYVLGHSLSLTDKTLLFEILNQKKCLNIHLFKRADIESEKDKIQDIKKLHFNISRILNNDKDSRVKIIPIEQTPHFPFVNNLDDKIIKEKYKTIYKENIQEIQKDVIQEVIDPDVINLLH
ncbi:AbiH family protein [Tenacibaculum maritimum]|uniref:AbiH family protein n=1 Tax=Tenacibaculum maritimum TaxID=107401 RepID=UPI0012E59055|nr:AbiH family protein [Tenacibaculum maritimum]CAA0227798.1 Bacteriophage abortive infection AbiH [Tenacibaculum maritimum]